MHADYVVRCNMEERKVYCYDKYRKKECNINISLAKLGSEECERCDAHRLHVERKDNRVQGLRGENEGGEKGKDMKKGTWCHSNLLREC